MSSYTQQKILFRGPMGDRTVTGKGRDYLLPLKTASRKEYSGTCCIFAVNRLIFAAP